MNKFFQSHIYEKKYKIKKIKKNKIKDKIKKIEFDKILL